MTDPPLVKSDHSQLRDRQGKQRIMVDSQLTLVVEGVPGEDGGQRSPVTWLVAVAIRVVWSAAARVGTEEDPGDLAGYLAVQSAGLHYKV